MYIKLINLKNWDVEEEINLDNIKSILNYCGYEKVVTELNRIGLRIDLTDSKIEKTNEFSRFFLERYFKGYTILFKTISNRVKGEPDFLLEKKLEKRKWVEVKNDGDGLKKDQINWILNNIEEEDIYLLCIGN